MDKFNWITFGGSAVEVLVPDQVVKPKETLRCLANAGLTVPRSAEVFWVNSKYCKITYNDKLIGELFYVAKESNGLAHSSAV
jgi:hypothetical protein